MASIAVVAPPSNTSSTADHPRLWLTSVTQWRNPARRRPPPCGVATSLVQWESVGRGQGPRPLGLASWLTRLRCISSVDYRRCLIILTMTDSAAQLAVCCSQDYWAWLKRLSAGIASSKLALQYYTKYVLFKVLLISQAEMIAELKTHK